MTVDEVLVKPTSKKFEPRHFCIRRYWHMFLVRPDVAELFFAGDMNPLCVEDVKRACQVKWINGKVVSPQGGLPFEAIETIFKEVNSDTTDE